MQDIAYKKKTVLNNLSFIRNVILISSAVGTEGIKTEKSNVKLKYHIIQK